MPGDLQTTTMPFRYARQPYLAFISSGDFFMSETSSVILISTLAEYQTEFWLAVGESLRQRGTECAYLSFDDRSTEMLRARRFQVFGVSDGADSVDVSDQVFAEVAARYGIEDLNYWFAHERVTFGVRDQMVLRRKLVTALCLADRACSTLVAAGKKVVMVQEVGGFLSVVGCFFAARRNAIDNWFIEPAFFRGRMFFLRNSFAAPVIDPLLPDAVSDPVAQYLDNTRRTGAIVVPQKDKHHYSTAFSKVVNRKNFRRLLVKLMDKHLHGKRQEFGYIGRHVAVHLKMLRNSLRLRKRYTPLAELGRFVYYPLHVPADMALTLRSPEYLDQLALIDYLVRVVPHTHKVAIKEHPAMIGALDARRICELLDRYDNLAVLSPSTNNYEVLRAADVVVSVNSKSGAEAMLLGKPVVVLGDAFYSQAPAVRKANRVTEIGDEVESAIRRGAAHDLFETERYFEQVWANSFPGELYVASDANVATFVDSLLSAVRRS